MRVAFLSWRDTSHPDGGGSEVYVETVARELARRGHRVDLVCAAHARAPSFEVRDGVWITRRGGRLTVYPRALVWLLWRRRRVDVVVDVVNGLPFATPLVRRRGVVALVHHLHEEQWHLIYPGLGGRLGWFVESRVTPWLYRRVPFLTVSRASAADLTRLGITADRVTVARNGVGPVPPSPTSPSSPTPRLCVLARLVPHKRIELALALVAELRHEFPDLVLDVIGEGWWRKELEAEALRLALGERVRFRGHVPADERDALLATAWVHLVPSVKEGWCLAVTEAGAQGTPSVGFAAAGGVAESVEHGVTGVLVRSPSELGAVTRRLLVDTAERQYLGRGAREKAAGLGWSSTTNVIEDVLRTNAEG